MTSFYWDKFYSSKNLTKKDPSPFARFVLKKIKSYHYLIDLGCGNGRDSTFFYKNGKKVIGLDKSKIIIKNNKKNSFSKKKLLFLNSDLTKKLPKEVNKKYARCFYSRFFIHSLKNHEIKKFLFLISKNLRKNDILFLEYRTFEDKLKSKTYKKHFRNFIKVKFLLNLIHKNNLQNIYLKKGINLAKYGKENPFIARHIIKKKY